MKILIILLLIFSLIGVSAFIGWYIGRNGSYHKLKPTISLVKARPLDKYTFENLSITDIEHGELTFGEMLGEEEDYTSYYFRFLFSPNLDGTTRKVTTGQINIPKGAGPFPMVVMIRGYIDQELYKTGDGTRRAAEFYTKNGYITIAPDFLGYANSDKKTENIFEARFQTYVTVLSLMKSLDQVQDWDEENVFLWGHSNGGQIALTILSITKANTPATLWAPVSKSFPYSVLFYTDLSEDRGKLIRSELAKFEEDYDPDLYSLDLYVDKISAPLLIHQGTLDEAVPVGWSDSLVNKLELLEKNVSYYTYPGANHNMVPGWDTVTARDLDFFSKIE